jgi:cholesterol oxidase
MSQSDKVMQTLANDLGKPEAFHKTDVAVYFGKAGETVDDPYFNGQGPDRTGCILCGGCMLGCRYNSKNTLDKNYLYLAQKMGAEIIAQSEVYDVKPQNADGSSGYMVFYKNSLSSFPKRYQVKAQHVIFAGGVLGTLKLLFKLKKTSLKNISDTLGHGVRTNSESLIGVTAYDKTKSFSKGIAIGSLIEIDENRHIEPVQYSEGSGFWRLLMAPMVSGRSVIKRFLNMMWDICTHPVKNLKTYFVDDWSKRTHILLYMESIESTLKMKSFMWGRLRTSIEKGKAPTSYNPVAQDLAHKTENIIGGKSMVMFSETLLGIPTTAHILGGACMGKNENEGVIDDKNRVFNYRNMWICDGSMISANIGVNPSLTITALTERAMSFIPEKDKIPVV